MKIPAIPILVSLLVGGVACAKNIPTNAAANLVLGQADFVTSTFPPLVNPVTLGSPTGIAVDPVTRKVFISDSGRNRVLRYANATSLKNGATPEAVFGQRNFSSASSANGEQGMNRPTGLFFDRKGRLWVADSSNNRVIMFEAAVYRESFPYADKVVGQPNFTTVTGDVTAAKLDDCYGVWVDKDDRLWVSDDDNNRVLRFNAISTKGNGPNADGVIGQVNFITGTLGNGSSATQHPIGISVSPSGSLFVACQSANRVMRFDNAANLGDGAGASAVFGQADFSGTTSGLSATQLNSPMGAFVAADDTLWVTDYGNSRLLRFDKASTRQSGAAADAVVGKPDFVTNTAPVSSRSVNNPFVQSSVDASGNLWVPDYPNNRVLRFPADAKKPSLTITSTVPNSTGESKLTIKGKASDTNGISKVQYKVNNGSLKNATLASNGNWQFKANLSPGKNKITIYATDKANNTTSKTVNVTRG